MGDGSEKAEGEHVIDLVVHIGAGGSGGEGMFVMPELVRTEALLVDKVMAGEHMGNFRHPLYPDAEKGGECIGDDLPGVHAFPVFFVGGHRKIHISGRDLLQIIRRGEKSPGLI